MKTLWNKCATCNWEKTTVLRKYCVDKYPIIHEVLLHINVFAETW